MARQFSVELRNLWASQIEPTWGSGATLEIREGPPPSSTTAADTGTLLSVIPLPADSLTVASNGEVTLNGSWRDPSADAEGTAGHYRIKDSGGTVHEQGTASNNAGAGDMKIANVEIVAGQPVEVTAYSASIGA